MGTPSLFNDILKSELNIHAAWLPVTNRFKLGDYGLMSDGVFHSIGNIRDFGIEPSEEGGPPASLDSSSEGTSVIRTVAGAEVKVLPDENIEAKLTIQFDRDSSFLVKANLVVRQMTDIRETARKLAQIADWENRFRVVSGVYVGENCIILSSKGSNSKIELTGEASALKQFDLGSVTGQVQISSSEKIGLQIVGKTGVVGLHLFKLGLLTSRLQLLKPDDVVPIEYSKDWPRELEDDA